MKQPIFLEQKASGMNPKSQEIGMKYTITDCSNFDKQCSSAHFVSFLFYCNCSKDFSEKLDADQCFDSSHRKYSLIITTVKFPFYQKTGIRKE